MIPAEAQAYEQMIDDAAVAAVTNGATTFPEILAALPSVYPSFALRSLERQVGNGALPACVLDGARLAASAPTAREGCGTGLPIPHPLDFECVSASGRSNASSTSAWH